MIQGLNLGNLYKSDEAAGAGPINAQHPHHTRTPALRIRRQVPLVRRRRRAVSGARASNDINTPRFNPQNTDNAQVRQKQVSGVLVT